MIKIFDTQLRAPSNASLRDAFYGAPRMLFGQQRCSLKCFDVYLTEVRLLKSNNFKFIFS